MICVQVITVDNTFYVNCMWNVLVEPLCNLVAYFYILGDTT